VGSISALPFADRSFELVCALDIVEHVDDDERALAELVRVTRDDGTLLLSVPLHPAKWTAFDDLVGHRRRYEPERLLGLLARHGLTVERSAAYGMQPESSRLLDFGVWGLTHRPRFAAWLYNRVLMPIGIRLQKPLVFVEELADMAQIDEILLVCVKQERHANSKASNGVYSFDGADTLVPSNTR
jgi:SAM-dependent methyltransferase